MILIQPVLTFLLLVLVVVYLARLRTRAYDSLLAMLCFAGATLLVVRPEIANQLAHFFGIGRGVDLIFYFAIPGLAMISLILFAKTRELNIQLTATIRELAINNAQVNGTKQE